MSKIKKQVDLAYAEDLLPSSQMAVFLLCLHMAEVVRELFGVFFIRALIPFMEVPIYNTVTSQRQHLHIPSHLGLGFSV